MGEPTSRPSADAKGADWMRFLATWARDPKKMGAVASSSRAYCATMVRNASIGVEGPILELGPGLGVVTRALLEAGVDPARITSIEYDPNFAETLKKRFPRVNVIWGDGFDLDATLKDGGETRFAAILFAIPILQMKQAERQALFSAYVRRLKPGGNLTQLSYAPTAPVKGVPGLFRPSSSPIVWANIPPARVWIYTPAGQGARAVTRILVLAGSNRAGAPERRLAAEAVRMLATGHPVDVARIDLADYPLPVFDGEGDGEGPAALPEAAIKLAGQFALADGALVATPEYGAAPAPLLVNALLWASRVRRLGNRPVLPLRGLVVGLAAAAPDRFGGVQALASLRGLFAALGAEVIARQCPLASSRDAFGADGRLARGGDRDALEKLVESLADIASALRRTA